MKSSIWTSQVRLCIGSYERFTHIEIRRIRVMDCENMGVFVNLHKTSENFFVQNFDKTDSIISFRTQCGRSAHVHLTTTDRTLLFTIPLLLLHILHHKCLAGGLGDVLPVALSIVSRLSSHFESRIFSIAVHKTTMWKGSLLCHLSVRLLFRGGRNSSVRIVTRYGLEGLGIKSWWGRNFRTRPDLPCCPSSLLYNWYRIFPRGKAAVAWCWPLSVPRS